MAARRGAWRRLRRGILVAFLIAGAVVMMAPFLWMILTSLKTRSEVFGGNPLSLPSGPHFENYVTMWNALPGVTFGTFFVNSIKLAALNTIGQLLSCENGEVIFSTREMSFSITSSESSSRRCDFQ